MQNCQYTRFLHIIVYTVYRIALYVTIYILKIWWKLLTWLLIRREAKNIFTKVFRLVSAEVSIYTGFTNNRIYGLSYIIICYRIYWKYGGSYWRGCWIARGEAKNVFTKVFRLVSAEVSIYTGFTNNRIYGLLYIIICYRIYIEKKQDIRSTAAPVRSKSQTGVWDPRESEIPAGREWIPDSDPRESGIPQPGVPAPGMYCRRFTAQKIRNKENRRLADTLSWFFSWVTDSQTDTSLRWNHI